MTNSAIGHRFRDQRSGLTLDVWFARGDVPARRGCLAEKVGLVAGDATTVAIRSLDEPPESPEDAYYRLHLLSWCERPPNSINLDGIFDVLQTVAWTSAGPVLPEDVPELRSRVAEYDHHLNVSSVDKFPRMTDYVTPSGVRIADGDRVRLGAHLVPGTTVMHEGFVNFNAGTLGPAMIEGRVTPGVTVGAHSDIGAGSSIMGTLSGGGRQRNSVGANSLLGANAGIGIALGDRCIVEAGLYVTAGTKVRTPEGEVVQARQLSGRSDLLYRRNSQTGAVEAVPSSTSNWGGLNPSLHAQ